MAIIPQGRQSIHLGNNRIPRKVLSSFLENENGFSICQTKLSG
jgi:hypothetical protein